MIITIIDEMEIKQCQEKLSNVLKAKLTNKGRYPYSNPSESAKIEMYYNDKIWWYY